MRNTCPTRKRCYSSEARAIKAARTLEVAWAFRSLEVRGECYHYECLECGCWHVTRMSPKKYARMQARLTSPR